MCVRQAIESDGCTLARLGLENNVHTSLTTEGLIKAMDVGTLDGLNLGMAHGGEYQRARTRDDLRKQLTLSFLGLKLKKERAGEPKMARSYVGKRGVSNLLGHLSDTL
jgi:hypothetical protein